MRALVLAISFLAFVVFPASAFAKNSKVAVVKIDGDSDAEVQGALKEALSDDFNVVSFKETSKAVKSVGFDTEEPSEKDFSKLAEELEVEVVVAAKLEGKGDTRTLRVKLYVKGKKSKKFSVQFGSAKSEKFKKTMKNTLADKIAAINKSGEDAEEEPKAKKGDDDEDDKKGKKVKKGKGDDEEEEEAASDTKKKGKKGKKGDDDEEATADEGNEDEDSPLPKSKKKKKKSDDDEEMTDEESEDGEAKGALHAANRAAIRVDAGLSVANRTLDFNSRVYEQAPKDYANNPVPGARINVEVYPGAFSDPKGRAAGFGFWGEFDRTLSLTLQTRDPATGNVVAAKATQQRFAVGAGYRFAFTKTETSPTFTIGINYAQRSFKADPSTLMGIMIDLPDTDYKMAQPIGTLRIPFSKSVALVAGARGMLITDAGAITSGAQYGQAKVFGVEVDGGLDIIVSSRIAIRLAGEFSQIGYTFTKGAGAKANNRDGDPNTKDVFGAADRSLGGSATLGVYY